MAYRVCWRVLQQHQDAEDAFQATFLLLAQKLNSVRKQQSLASWIHGVAYRVALKARTGTLVRRRHEDAAGSLLAERTESDERQVLLQILDAELQRLPDQWRLPVLLHYFEGRSHEEAARELSWSKNTFRRRLDRARACLHVRLRRSGVVWPLAVSACVVSELAAEGAVPKLTMTTTMNLVSSALRGQALFGASDRVQQLVQGVSKTMALARIKLAAFTMLGAALFCGGAGLFAHRVFAEAPARNNPRLASPVTALERPANWKPDGDDQAPTVKNTAPVIVRTEPVAGDTKVDASVKEIKVTFSKEMKDGSWSWSQISKDTFPQLNGKPHFEKDKRTCVLPVKLEAGKTYVIWINPARFQGFVDTEGNPAVFYPLVFETK
jgi:RNA polymerase sigma-70 factor (ECF subfamily)